ncbi:hypothetical protein [Proteus sp. NMG38-2]|uniref:hypothetical protein n=1 Tax=Proteus sp. NMG38-2 TaxID=2883107 RepID=UPI001D09D96B|nr:hypothetical protein [Proteus sp. NMG38-2]UDN34548.1 hypothetical protein LG402_12320 [Proteus sp. NMG38-2]
MALVKVVSNNFFAGAGFLKVEAGSQMTMSDECAKEREKAGLVEILSSGDVEVASPSNDNSEQPEQPEQAKAKQSGKK